MIQEECPLRHHPITVNRKNPRSNIICLGYSVVQSVLQPFIHPVVCVLGPLCTACVQKDPSTIYRRLASVKTLEAPDPRKAVEKPVEQEIAGQTFLYRASHQHSWALPKEKNVLDGTGK